MTGPGLAITVHGMNKNDSRNKVAIERHSADLQELVEGLFQCCQERMHYQSERFGLPEAEMRCLLHFHGERYLTAKGLAGRMNVAKSRVTTLVDGLLRKNLLEKSDDPEDSRVKLLKLTADGERLVAQILELRRLLHLKVVEEFPPEQRAQLLNTLSQLRRAMEAVRELFV